MLYTILTTLIGTHMLYKHNDILNVDDISNSVKYNEHNVICNVRCNVRV